MDAIHEKFWSDMRELELLFQRQVSSEYRLALEGWHQSKREFPHLTQPLPDVPSGLDAETAGRIKREVDREYTRTF